MGADEYPHINCDWITASTLSAGRQDVRDRKVSGVINWVSVLALPVGLLLFRVLRRRR